MTEHQFTQARINHLEMRLIIIQGLLERLLPNVETTALHPYGCGCTKDSE